jgi:hypothetical protein
MGRTLPNGKKEILEVAIFEDGKRKELKFMHADRIKNLKEKKEFINYVSLFPIMPQHIKEEHDREKAKEKK